MESNDLADWLRKAFAQLGVPSTSFGVAMTSRYSPERDRTDYRVMLTFRLFATPPFDTLRHVEGRLFTHLARSSAPGTVEIFAWESGTGAGSAIPARRAADRGSLAMAGDSDEGDPVGPGAERGRLN
jgi:hypothetical protein